MYIETRNPQNFQLKMVNINDTFSIVCMYMLWVFACFLLQPNMPWNRP